MQLRAFIDMVRAAGMSETPAPSLRIKPFVIRGEGDQIPGHQIGLCKARVDGTESSNGCTPKSTPNGVFRSVLRLNPASVVHVQGVLSILDALLVLGYDAVT